MQNTTALVLAGGINLGFSVLTHNRAKSALPFGGHFRVIDYILTNLSNSGVNNVGILIQYLPGSLIDHVGVGASWDFATTNRRIKLMPPFIGMGKTDWFRGSADAIYQNLNYIHDTRAENVLVLSADHVYCMDYSKVLAFHKQHNADLTIVTTKRPSNTPADHFGYVTSDENKRVTEFLEKPHETPHDTVSTGIYLFSAQALIHYMKALEDRASKHDLPTSVVVPLSKEGRVFAYSYEGDWNCLPDLQAYVDHHFQVLRGEKSLHLPADPIITNLQDRDLGSRPSPYFGRLSNVQESMISPGCVVEGTVIRSVLSPGVYIGPHAHVENSILFHDCQVHEGVNLQGVFCDKDVVFHPYCQVGEAGLDPQNPDIRKMTLIGKGAQFAQGVRVGSGKEIQIDQVVQHDWATHTEKMTSTP